MAVFSSQEVEGEMDPGKFCSIPQFMESAGVYRFLTQIPTWWITAKVVRRSSRTFCSHIIIFVVESLAHSPHEEGRHGGKILKNFSSGRLLIATFSNRARLVIKRTSWARLLI